MADHTTRIAEIRTILQAGVTSATIDGTTVSYDLASLRKELRELMATDNTEAGRRPMVARIKLSGIQ